MISEQKLKQRLGIAGFIGLIVVTLMILGVGAAANTGNYDIFVRFPSLEGIQEFSAVNINGGFKVGHVAGIEQEGKTQTLQLRLKKKYEIPKERIQFSVYTTGFMGAKYINIFAPVSEGPLLEDGDRFEGVPPGNINESLRYFSTMFTDEEVADEKNFSKLVEEAKQEIVDLNAKLKKIQPDVSTSVEDAKVSINDGLAALNQAIGFLEKNTQSIGAIDELTKSQLQSSLNSYYTMSQKLNLMMVKGAKNRTKLIGKFLFEETQYEKFRQFAEYYNGVTEDFADEPYVIFNSD